MKMIGADTQALRDLGAQFRSGSEQLLEIRASVGGRLGNTRWVGSDAEQFRGRWTSELQTTVTQVSQALVEAADRLDANAQAQDQTSADGGGLTGPGALGASIAASVKAGIGIADDPYPYRPSGPDVQALQGELLKRIIGAIPFIGYGVDAYDAFGIGYDLGSSNEIDVQLWSLLRGASLNIGVFNPGLGLALDSAIQTSELFIPIGSERQQALLDHTRFRLYGSNPTPEQIAELTHRYEGVGGYFNMLNDSVIEATDNPGSNVFAWIARGGGNALADGIWGTYKAGQSAVDGIAEAGKSIAESGAQLLDGGGKLATEASIGIMDKASQGWNAVTSWLSGGGK